MHGDDPRAERCDQRGHPVPAIAGKWQLHTGAVKALLDTANSSAQSALDRANK